MVRVMQAWAVTIFSLSLVGLDWATFDAN